MTRLDKVISEVAYILDSLQALRNIHETGCCNDCKFRVYECYYAPKAGQMVRYNCPFYIGMEEQNE